jgi:hypothetical protein
MNLALKRGITILILIMTGAAQAEVKCEDEGWIRARYLYDSRKVSTSEFFAMIEHTRQNIQMERLRLSYEEQAINQYLNYMKSHKKKTK